LFLKYLIGWSIALLPGAMIGLGVATQHWSWVVAAAYMGVLCSYMLVAALARGPEFAQLRADTITFGISCGFSFIVSSLNTRLSKVLQAPFTTNELVKMLIFFLVLVTTTIVSAYVMYRFRQWRRSRACNAR
jgi:uncharacterized membrane protein